MARGEFERVIMPLIGSISPGRQSYVDWKTTINGQVIPYGVFLGELVNFIVVG